MLATISPAITGKQNIKAKPFVKKRRFPVFTELVSRIDWSRFRPKRAGIIPYTFHEGKIIFGMGIDHKFQELTDFGGGARYTKDKDAVVGALREFTEESLHVFGPLFPESIQNAIVSYTQVMAIFFVYINVNPRHASLLFQERVSTLDVPEVSSLAWLSLDEFKQALTTGRTSSGMQIYSCVRRMLKESRFLK